MANVLPYLRNTSTGLQAQVLYPFNRIISFKTFVQVFMNGSEQRWPSRPPLYTFIIPMKALLSGDKGSWLTFFNTVKGMSQVNLQLSLGATTYSDLTLMSDDLGVTTQRPLQYDQQFTLRQVKFPYASWTPSTAPTSYPTLACGAVAELPFLQVSTYLTSVNESKLGPRFAFSWYGSSLTNFPPGYLRMWKLTYPLLNDADLATLEYFFTACQGRLVSFSFTDPIDSTAYTHVRLDSDEMEIKYMTKGQYSTTLSLRQTNGS